MHNFFLEIAINIKILQKVEKKETLAGDNSFFN